MADKKAPSLRAMSVSRHALGFALAGGILWAATSAQAQTQPIPPEYYTLDARGVDLVTGDWNVTTSEVVIGSGAGQLTYGRVAIGQGWRDLAVGGLTCVGNTCSVVYNGVSEVFTLVLGQFVPRTEQGATLKFVPGGYEFVASDGTEAFIAHARASNMYQADGLITKVRRTNGEVTNFTFNVNEYCSDPQPQGCEQTSANERLQTVSNNYGFAINYQYTTEPYSPYDRNYFAPVKVVGYNRASEWCDDDANGCPQLSSSWPSVTYTYQGDGASGYWQHATDQAGRVTRYHLDVTGQLDAVHRPGQPGPDAAVLKTNGQVTQAFGPDGAWAYGYNDSLTYRDTTAYGPLAQRVYVRSLIGFGRPILIVRGSPGQDTATSYEYDAENRLSQVRQDEGDRAVFTYDDRGNIIQTVYHPKLLSTEPVITTSATFPTSCTVRATCNLPVTTTDARGNVTNYEYDPTHGGVVSITAPAPTTGAVRPQSRIAYAPRNAWFKNSSGVIVQSPDAITLPIQTSTCATGQAPTCIGTDAETRSSLTYGATGVANNLLPTAVTAASGSGSITSAVAMTYDRNGDLLTRDGPLPGAEDTTRYRYDVVRRLVGVVGPDPDGPGSRPRQAQRISYRQDDAVMSVESGTVINDTDPAWAAFQSLQRQVNELDSYGRVVKTSAQSGVTTYAVQQFGYDAAGRLECAAVRMNPAVFDALTTAPCVLGSPAGFGPDRITRIQYDTQNRPLSTISALGTPQQSTESATYTRNGKVSTLTDGKGNVSTYVYDPFDRVSQLRYPNASGGGSSTTDYEEYGYDAASNVTSSRLRGGQVFGAAYDALNRPTLITAPTGQTAVENVTYTYDNLGRTLSASMPSQTTTMTWDALGRKLSETGPLGVMAYQYDVAGRRTRMTWPDGFYVTYGYDQTNAMTAIRQAGITPIADYAYDNLGRRAAITRGNGVTTTYGYDAVSRLTSLSHDLAGTAFDQTYTYAYNPAGQVVSQSSSNPAYAYTGLASGTDNYAINGRNQVSALNGTPLTNGSSGNLRTDGTRSFTFDFANRLINNTAGASLTYDALGRLYDYTGTNPFKAAYDGAEVSALAVSGADIQNRFVRGPGPDEIVATFGGTPATTVSHYWLQDRLGSLIALADPTGAKFAINAYDEYGQPQAGNTARFQYTGQLWMPDFGVYHYKARAYHPGLGRFLQPDPIGYQAGANLFAYVGADPMNFRDPLGLSRILFGGIGECKRIGGTPTGKYDAETGYEFCETNPAFGGAWFGLGGTGWSGDGSGGASPWAVAIANSFQGRMAPPVQCYAGGRAARIGNALDIGSKAHDLMKGIVEIGAGPGAAGNFGPMGGAFSTASSMNSTILGFERGQSSDVIFVNVALPQAGASFGGAVGGVALGSVGIFSGPGAVAAVAAGVIGGGVVGEAGGTMVANSYAKLRGQFCP